MACIVVWRFVTAMSCKRATEYLSHVRFGHLMNLTVDQIFSALAWGWAGFSSNPSMFFCPPFFDATRHVCDGGSDRLGTEPLYTARQSRRVPISSTFRLDLPYLGPFETYFSKTLRQVALLVMWLLHRFLFFCGGFAGDAGGVLETWV